MEFYFHVHKSGFIFSFDKNSSKDDKGDITEYIRSANITPEETEKEKR